MATEKNTEAKTEKVKKDERVEVMIPRGSANGDPNLVVGVNGKMYILPRGKKSKVPKAVADEIERSIRAQERQDANSDALEEKSK